MKRKVALVTGSNRGIGKSCIEDFARAGVNVVINYCHHEDEAEELEKYIKENYDVEVLTIKCDISKEEEVEQMVDEIIEVFGGIDILVNNASVARDSLLMDKNIKEFKRVLDVNLIGTYLVSKYVGKVMLDQKYGKIINVSSTNAIDTYYPESCDYDASKAALISLTHNLAIQCSPYVNVNAIAPGFIGTESELDGYDQQFLQQETEKILLKRYGKPQEVAYLVKFLISDQAQFINNSVIRIDGGQLSST